MSKTYKPRLKFRFPFHLANAKIRTPPEFFLAFDIHLHAVRWIKKNTSHQCYVKRQYAGRSENSRNSKMTCLKYFLWIMSASAILFYNWMMSYFKLDHTLLCLLKTFHFEINAFFLPRIFSNSSPFAIFSIALSMLTWFSLGLCFSIYK